MSDKNKDPHNPAMDLSEKDAAAEQWEYQTWWFESVYLPVLFDEYNDRKSSNKVKKLAIYMALESIYDYKIEMPTWLYEAMMSDLQTKINPKNITGEGYERITPARSQKIREQYYSIRARRQNNLDDEIKLLKMSQPRTYKDQLAEIRKKPENDITLEAVAEEMGIPYTSLKRHLTLDKKRQEKITERNHLTIGLEGESLALFLDGCTPAKD